MIGSIQENPCEHPIVILKDVRYCDLESLLKYMYAGQVHIKQDQLGRSAGVHRYKWIVSKDFRLLFFILDKTTICMYLCL